jgi:hypothetical protein
MVELKNVTVHTQFTDENGVIKVSGNAVVNEKNEVTSLNGDITKNDAPVCNFNAWRSGDKLQYNFSTTDITALCEVIPAVSGIEDGIIQQLAAADAE